MKKNLIIGLALLISSQAFSIEAVNHYELAIRAYDAGKTDEAFIHLKNAIQTNPTHLPSKLLLGKVYFNSGNVAAAEQELTQALEMGADINLVLPLLGSSLIIQKKVDKLLQYEDQYYNLSREGKFEWHLLRGQAYILNTQAELAGFEFKEAQKISPDDTRANNTLATLYISMGKLKDAEVLINHALEIEPSNEKTWYLKGELALKQQNQDLALDSFSKAYELDSSDPKILRSLTLSHLNKGNLKQARELNTVILEQSPNDPTATLIEAWYLTNEGKSEQAKNILARLSQDMSLLDPATMLYDRNTTMVRGIAELMQGNLETSQKLLLKHIEESSGDSNALKILAQVYIEKNQYTEALSLLENKSRVVTQNLELGLLLIQLYLHENNLFRAEQIQNKLSRNFPDEPALRIAQARIYDLKGQRGIALATLNSVKTDKPSQQFLLLKGKLLLNNGQLDKARNISNQLLEQNTQNIDALNLLAGVMIANSEYDEARNTLKKVLSIEPNNITAIFNSALMHKNLHEYSQAQATLSNIISLTPSHKATLLELTELALLTSDLKAAELWVNKLLTYYPEDLAANRKLSIIYMAQERWSDALLIVSRLLQNDRFNTTLLLQQARIYSAMRNIEGARSNFTVVYELWLNDPAKLHFLSSLQIKNNDLQGAKKTLNKILALSSDHYSAKIDLARLALMEKQPEETQKLISELMKDNANTSALHLLKGDLASYKQQQKQAVEEYVNAIKIDPDTKVAIVKLYLLAKEGYGQKIFFSTLEGLLTSDPTSTWKRKLLADAYLDHHNWPLAEQHYQKLLDTNEYHLSPTILNNLANIYARTDLNKAYQTAKLALDNGGNKNPALLDTLGWIMAKQQKFTDALAYLREAYVLDSKNPEIRYHLGHTLSKLDRKEEAITQLKIATQNDSYPEFEDAVLLLENLN
ncbi:XrtA/PEP-CTERM system TPR-repeat protein PrsT [Neptunicella sp. SCSIO 80796]|uniref:XrtA/PEP-CTERM system TPR-repeat protein PrsT n=1 Tax=Neptunicella plasticusilytica TaxID=3117012 RepID=UPI003A4D8BD5